MSTKLETKRKARTRTRETRRLYYVDAVGHVHSCPQNSPDAALLWRAAPDWIIGMYSGGAAETQIEEDAEFVRLRVGVKFIPPEELGMRASRNDGADDEEAEGDE